MIIQGFHLFCDTSDGFGGLTSEIVAEVRDEFPKRGILTFCPLHEPSTVSTHSLYLIGEYLIASLIQIKCQPGATIARMFGFCQFFALHGDEHLELVVI